MRELDQIGGFMRSGLSFEDSLYLDQMATDAEVMAALAPERDPRMDPQPGNVIVATEAEEQF